jgi:hypothetical protein
MAIADSHQNIFPSYYRNGKGTELDQVLADPTAVREVACRLLGTPNAHLSKGTDLRFGSHGSLLVDISAGTFYDHEGETGGGLLGGTVDEFWRLVAAAPTAAEAVVPATTVLSHESASWTSGSR